MTLQQESAHADRKHEDYKIVVNGTPAVVDHKVVTYEEVVAIAFPGAHSADVIYSVAYSKADTSHGGSGMLVAGGSVKVKQKGTSFNVTPTTRS